METQEFQTLVLQKFDSIDKRFDGIETRFDWLETKVDGLETKVDGLETRFDWLETKVDGFKIRFDWLESKVDCLSEDFQSFREESRTEHDTTRALLSQAFGHISENVSHEVRLRSLEREVFPKRFVKA